MKTKSFRLGMRWILTVVGTMVSGGAVGGQTLAGPQVNFIPATIRTVAGGGILTSDGGLATRTSLNGASGMVVDSQGNVYVASPRPGGIRKVSAADGRISTVVGSTGSGLGGAPGGGELGGGTVSGDVRAAIITRDRSVPANQISLGSTGGLALSASGELYFSDPYNAVIYKLDLQGSVSVVAGNFHDGYSANGTLATAAMLSGPTGLAFDQAGNLYFSDTNNQVLRRVNASDGTVATVAGTAHTAGYTGDGFSALQAQLNTPMGLAIDRNGNLFVADKSNSAIRKVVLATGAISTVAGTGTAAFSGDGGPANKASLGSPSSVAVDASGQLYIADTDDSVVRLINAKGIISVVAGVPGFYGGAPQDGTSATAATFSGVDGVAIDSNGSLYVASDGQRRVYSVGVNGNLDFGIQLVKSTTTLTLAVENTGAADLVLSATPFSVQGAMFLAVATPAIGCTSGLVLLSGQTCSIDVSFMPTAGQSYTGTLSLMDNAANSPQTAQLTGQSVLPATQTALTVSPQTAASGDSVTFAAAVRPVSGSTPAPTGTVVFRDLTTATTLATATLTSQGNASVSRSTLAAGSYDVTANYSGDTNFRASISLDRTLTIRAIATTITLITSANVINSGSSVTLTAQVNTAGSGAPSGLVLFATGGTVIGSAAVQNGATTISTATLLPGQYGLTATYVGDARFASSSSNTITLTVHGALLQFTPGAATTLAGVPGNGHSGAFSGDGGAADAAHLFTPSGLATDSGGNVYIADEQNNVIRRVAADGTISTVAGVPYVGSLSSTRFGGDGGLATNAYLDNPEAVVVDGAGNLYIADYSNNVVRKVAASTGIITTYAGKNGSQSYTGDNGPATSVGLYHPIALALDKEGNLYIADMGNNLIRRVDTSGQMTTIAGNFNNHAQGNPVNNQPATTVPLNQPSGVAISPAGEVYISDTRYSLLRKIAANGNLVTVAGGGASFAPGDGGPALGAYLNYPGALTFDAAGNLYVVDQQNNAIRRIDPVGTITTVAGILNGNGSGGYLFDPTGAPATSFNLEGPSGVALDSAGNLLISDTYNETVLRVGPAGSLVFGPQVAGVTSPPETVTLFNAGDQSLTFGATPYTVTGDYVVAPGGSACSFAKGLAPGASCSLSIRYRNAAGALTGAVTFAANTITPPIIQLKTNSTATYATVNLTLSQTTANIGDNIQLFATISAPSVTATGSVAFYDGTTLLNSAPITSGYAVIYVSTFSKGTHTITATYSGDAIYGSSSSASTDLVVSPPPSFTTLAVSSTNISLGSSVSLTATVTDASNARVGSGALTFFDGSQTFATVTVNASGQALFTASSLSQGQHTFTAIYQANQSYASSTSAAVLVTVTGGGGGGTGGSTLDYVINSLGLPATIRRGQSTTLALDIQGISASLGTVTPSCGTLPKYATCTFSPSSVSVSASTLVPAVVWTISTTPLP